LLFDVPLVLAPLPGWGLPALFLSLVNPAGGTAGSRAVLGSAAAFCKPFLNHHGEGTSGNMQRKPPCSEEITDLSLETARQ